MAATLYTGNGSTQSVSNAVNTVSFQPDLVWTKSRSAATGHQLADSVRGATKYLQSNNTNAEGTDVNVLTAFNSGGFSIGNDAGINTSAATYVGWQWKAGGTAVSNTAGTITSSVSANTTAGFSVVTYTGNGVNSTMGHGLGVAPAMIFYKSRTTAEGWPVYHSALAIANNLALSSSNAQQPNGNIYWNSTAPTSTLIRAGTDTGNNGNGTNYVAYCWAPVAGYSAFGSYTGNGSADGPFIYTGFRPRFVLYKKYSAAGNDWRIWDSSRNTSNATTLGLYPNTSVAEDTSAGPIDILSNGFKLRTAGTGDNGSGDGFIYAAFAENPLKFSNAR
jgi:hypothetical protein